MKTNLTSTNAFNAFNAFSSLSDPSTSSSDSESDSDGDEKLEQLNRKPSFVFPRSHLNQMRNTSSKPANINESNVGILDGSSWQTVKARQRKQRNRSSKVTGSKVSKNRVALLKETGGEVSDGSGGSVRSGLSARSNSSLSYVENDGTASLEDLQHMEEDVAMGRVWGRSKKSHHFRAARQRYYAMEKRSRQRGGY